MWHPYCIFLSYVIFIHLLDIKCECFIPINGWPFGQRVFSEMRCWRFIWFVWFDVLFYSLSLKISQRFGIWAKHLSSECLLGFICGAGEKMFLKAWLRGCPRTNLDLGKFLYSLIYVRKPVWLIDAVEFIVVIG